MKEPAARPKSSTFQPAGPERGAIATAPVALKEGRSEWLPVIIVGVPILAMVAALLGWIWLLHSRAQGRVAGQIKEIKSKAVDVMDRLDALKERLKLMPTSTEFKLPMTGETKALFMAVNEKLGKLWDGWLEVMDVLAKAEKLAARSGSPLSRKTLADAEDLISVVGVVRGDRDPVPGDLGRRGPARPRTPGGLKRWSFGAVTTAWPTDRRGVPQEVRKLGLSTGAIGPGRAGGRRRGIDASELGAGGRSAWYHNGAGTAPVAVGCLPGANRTRGIAFR